MSRSLKIPQLEAPPEGPATAVEQAQFLSNASRLVEDYAQKCAPSSLDALLAAGKAGSPGEAAEQALRAAEAANAQAETLIDEVERFLTLTQHRPSKAS